MSVKLTPAMTLNWFSLLFLCLVAGAYPIVINTRNNFAPGKHVVTLRITDAFGYMATADVNFELSDDKAISNSKCSSISKLV